MMQGPEQCTCLPFSLHDHPCEERGAPGTSSAARTGTGKMSVKLRSRAARRCQPAAPCSDLSSRLITRSSSARHKLAALADALHIAVPAQHALLVVAE